MRFRGRVLTTATSFPVPAAAVSADSILLQGLSRLFCSLPFHLRFIRRPAARKLNLVRNRAFILLKGKGADCAPVMTEDKGEKMIRAFKMRLEYGMGPEFEKRHAEVWPEVEKMIHEYGGSNCSVFLDERQGVLFGVITVEDEDRWATIRDNVLLKKWFEHIAPTMKMTRENRPDAVPLRMVFHMN